jgi:site-specific DNA-methyltransferase (adenine-specific)
VAVIDPSVRRVLRGEGRWAGVQADALAFLRTLPDASVDALITDPPYSSGGQYRGDRVRDTRAKYIQMGTKKQRDSFTGDNRDQRSFVIWCTLWLSECARVLKAGAPVCLFTDWRQLPATTDALQAGGFVWRGLVPWNKGDGARPVLGRFRAQAEYVVWGSNGPMPTARKVGALPGAYTVAVRQADKFHQTGKPTELMRRINAICAPRGIILDPFFGSGTTGAAALVDGYRVIGVEKMAAHASVARQRLRTVARRGHR